MRNTLNSKAHNRQEGHREILVSSGEFDAALLRVEKAFEYETDYEILRTWEWIRTMSQSKREE